MKYNSYTTRYIPLNLDERIIEEDKVIIKYSNKVFTGYVTKIGTKYIEIRNGIYKYMRHRYRDGISAEYLNYKKLELSEIQNICKYPKHTQDEPTYISNLNWKLK